MSENRKVYIWHGVSSENDTGKDILDEYYLKRWHPVFGGSTVGSRAIGLAYQIGVRHLTVYGMDCCYIGERHHVYEQEENDEEISLTIQVNGRKFQSAIWMAAQLDEMMQMLHHLPDDMEFAIAGDGLLAYTLQLAHELGAMPKVEIVER